jgi:RNA polymerase sigma factor (sigma-70 family)
MDGHQTLANVTDKHHMLAMSAARLIQRTAYHLCEKANNYDDLWDLRQEGYLGALSAATRYKSDANTKFETFAHGRIEGQMLDYLIKGSGPRNARRRRQELDGIRQNLQASGTEVSSEEIAKRLDMDLADFQKLEVNLRNIEELRKWRKCSADHPLLPRACDNVEDELILREQCEMTRQAISRLENPRHRKIKFARSWELPRAGFHSWRAALVRLRADKVLSKLSKAA